MKHGYAKRQDANHESIKISLQQLGYAVLDLKSLAGGAPDLLVMTAWRSWLIEIKTKNGRLNKKQLEWRQQWKGPLPITAHSLEEILQEIQK